MKLNYYSRKTSTVHLFAIILIFTSCTSKKLTSEYPNLYSVDQKKLGFHFAKRHKKEHSIIAFNDLVKSDLSSVSNSESPKIFEEQAVAQLKGNASKSDIRLITSKIELPISDYNQGQLTASLSDEPFVLAHKFRPDTAIMTTFPVPDSTTNKVAQTPTPEIEGEGNGKDETSHEVFAIISAVSALLAIVTLVLALPGAFILLAIAAIVFGALGLKSGRRKLAMLGLIIGILGAVFLIGAVIYVSIYGFSGGL